MPTPQKEATVAELTEQFREAKSLLFADYRGLDVEAISELRKRCREAGVRFRVSKNTLTRLAMSELGLADLGEILDGPTGTAMALEDELAPARVLVDFAKEHEKLEVKGGFMDGRVYTIDEVTALASLPPRDQLIAQFLSMIESPLTQVLRAADSLVQDVLSCAEQAAEGKGSAPAAAAEAPAAEAEESSAAESQEAPAADSEETPAAESTDAEAADAAAGEAPAAGGDDAAPTSSEEPKES